jgi:hypothetical protein
MGQQKSAEKERARTVVKTGLSPKEKNRMSDENKNEQHENDTDNNEDSNTPTFQPLPLTGEQEPTDHTPAPTSYSLTDIERLTGIAYPTLARYVKAMPDLPVIGEGRARRYLPAAVDMFVEMRSTADSRKGVKPAGGVDASAPAISASTSTPSTPMSRPSRAASLASRKGPKRGRPSARPSTSAPVPKSSMELMQGIERALAQAKLEALTPIADEINAEIRTLKRALGQDVEQ